MKNLVTTILFLCLCIIYSYAQDNVNVLYDGIQQAKRSGEKFEPVSVFTSASKSATQSRRIEEHFIQPQEVYFLYYSPPTVRSLNASIMLNLPLGSRNLQLELQEFHMDYQIETSSGQFLTPNKNIRHYHGVVNDDPHSIVAITFAENEIIGLVANDEGNFNLAFDRSSGAHIYYNDKNLKQKPDFDCFTETDNFSGYSAEELFQNTRSSVTQKYVQMYLETEYDIFQTVGSQFGVEFLITAIFNQVALLYRNESINVSMSFLYIWDTFPFNYPYSSNDHGGLLDQFQNYRAPKSINGDVGQLLTFRDLNAGIVSGMGVYAGLCDSDPRKRLSVARIQNGYQIVPIYSGSVYVVAHEFGHLLGSRETHECVWTVNGVANKAIDGCEVPSPCSNPGIPSGGGTIMSYCQKQSVGINFNKGFGPLPGNAIRNRVATVTCLLTIAGDNSICYGTAKTFTATNWKSTNYYWQHSANVSLSTPTSSPTVNVSAASSSSIGPGWVSINNSYGTEIARFHVWVGLPVIDDLSGPSSVVSGGSGYYETSMNSLSLATVTGYTWALRPDYGAYMSTFGYYAGVSFYTPDSYYQVTCQAKNSCGTGSGVSKNVWVYQYSPSPAYPNPVSDVLNIDLSDSKTQGSNFTFDVRLYDGQGNLLRQTSTKGGTVEFNVSNLPDGTYYLHIYDGVSSTPEMKQIFVEH